MGRPTEEAWREPEVQPSAEMTRFRDRLRSWAGIRAMDEWGTDAAGGALPTGEATRPRAPGHYEQYVTALQAVCVVMSYVFLSLALLLFAITFLVGDLVTDALGMPRPPPEVAFHVMTRLVLLIFALTATGVGTLVAAWRLSKRVPR